MKMVLQAKTTRTTRYNTGLAKVAVLCSADTFVVNKNLVLRGNKGSARIDHQTLADYEL